MANTSTRVDDMLIEMITPKVKEIEEKFGNNQALIPFSRSNDLDSHSKRTTFV